MRSMAIRLLAGTVLAVAAWMLLAGAATTTSKPSAKPSTKTNIIEPDKLVILSTVDVKGKASPCG